MGSDRPHSQAKRQINKQTNGQAITADRKRYREIYRHRKSKITKYITQVWI